jgi:hypothetical protein
VFGADSRYGAAGYGAAEYGALGAPAGDPTLELASAAGVVFAASLQVPAGIALDAAAAVAPGRDLGELSSAVTLAAAAGLGPAGNSDTFSVLALAAQARLYDDHRMRALALVPKTEVPA